MSFVRVQPYWPDLHVSSEICFDKSNLFFIHSFALLFNVPLGLDASLTFSTTLYDS